MHVHVRTCTYAHAVDREQYSQMNANANARKLIVAMDAWVISACKRDCDLHVRSKTFRMYYTYQNDHQPSLI